MSINYVYTKVSLKHTDSQSPPQTWWTGISQEEADNLTSQNPAQMVVRVGQVRGNTVLVHIMGAEKGGVVRWSGFMKVPNN